MKKATKFLAAVAMFAMAFWLVPVTAYADEYSRVTILHTNDIHGRFVQSSTSIGIDTVAAILAGWENAVLVDAGDTFHGVPFVNFEQGANAVELMNLAGYSVFTPGNHDFNFGIDRLLELEDEADFAFVSANITRGGAPVFDAYTIIEVDGFSLGFFGLATPDTPTVTHPDNVAGLTFGDPVPAARAAVAALQAHEVDVIIAVAHLGVDGEVPPSVRVAEEVEGIHLIIDGHSHTLLEEGKIVGDVLIAQTGGHLRQLGAVEIVFSSEGELLYMDAFVIDHETALDSFEPVAAITAAAEAMSAEIDEILGEVVAYSPVYFDGDRDYLRNMEMPLGNLAADSMRWATDADLALTNSGGLRVSIEAGDVTMYDIIAVMPFFNFVVVAEITPAELLEALENGVSNMPGNGRFPQISGFAFTFDPEAEEGSRVQSITVDGEELDLEDTTTTFTIAINDFIQAGGDGFSVFQDLPRVMDADTQAEVLIAYMAVADLSAIEVEGRITEVTAEAAVVAEEDLDEALDYLAAVLDLAEEDEYEEEVPLWEVVTVVYEVDEVVIEVEEVAEVAVEVAVETPAPVAGTGTIVNCWFLNVRAAGNPQANVLGTVRVGEVVTIFETRFGWHRIETANISGWVYGGYVQVN